MYVKMYSLRCELTVVAVAVLWWCRVEECAAQAGPPLCRTPPPSTTCDKKRSSDAANTYHDFTVQGIDMHIKYKDTISLYVHCENTGAYTSSLDEREVPRFKNALLVRTIRILGCPAPLGSYRAMFTAMNVTFPADGLKLVVEKLTGSIDLTEMHFSGQSSLSHLELLEVGPLSVSILKGLTIKTLVVADSRIPESEFNTKTFDPNTTLASLSLKNTSVNRVPAAFLALPALKNLKVLESNSVVVERGAGRALRLLHIEVADAALFSEWAPPVTEEVTLVGWEAERPRSVPNCRELRWLTVKSPRAVELPAGWVASCPLLKTLEVKLARRLTSVPATLLANATSLVDFTFTNGALTSIPRELFQEARQLTSIDLTDNHLKFLPSGVFWYPKSLSSLRLGRNELTSSVLSALGDLPALTRLVLAHNVHVTAGCGEQPIHEGFFYGLKGESGLCNLSNLKYLDLKNTNVSVICQDWRENLKHLRILDLSYTKISTLTEKDLMYKWWNEDNGSVVILEHTPLSQLAYGPEQYSADVAAAASGTPRVRLRLGGDEMRLKCDCSVYWLAAAINAGVGPLRVAPLSSLWCNSTEPSRPPYELDLHHIDTLVCERTEVCRRVPAACRCGVRALPANRTLLRVDCAGAGLSAPPRLHSLPANVTVDLLLANNSIADLYVDDLPQALHVLDLRNNSIERIDEKTALAIVAVDFLEEGRVLLTDNRVACDCRNAAALRTLLRLGSRLELKCAAGESVEVALAALACLAPRPRPRAAGGGAALGAVLGALALIAVAGLALLAHPATRRRLKRALRGLRWGVAPSGPRFDLFLTFPPGREALALAVASRLEPRYLVCLQERDWLPPARRAACYSHSVAASRRTVALVSAEWARALDAEPELRSALALALRGRLLAVLLGDEPPPDGTLRRYLARHPAAALRYADDDFWQKLTAALPPPHHSHKLSKETETVHNL